MKRTRRALLAWEGGAGRGHVVHLKAVATALRDDFVFDAALCRLEYAGEIAPHCALVCQGPYLPYDASRRGREGVRTATFGEFLGDLGFRDPAFLARQIGWWRETIRARRISLVFGDYAPCALIAARSLGVPCVGVSTGYGLPPAHMETFPVLLPEFAERLYDEKEMVDALNGVLAPWGARPLDRLPQVYACDASVVTSFPMLDPYAQHRTAPNAPPVADLAQAIAGGGEEIFIYFSTTERENAALMDAVAALKAPVRMFMPNIDEGLAERFARAGVIVERAPAPVDDLCRRTRLMVNSGQQGIVSLGLAAGLPQALFPQHLEHLFATRRLEKAGVGREMPRRASAAEIVEAIESVYHDARAANAARALAHDVRPLLAQDLHEGIRERVAGL